MYLKVTLKCEKDVPEDGVVFRSPAAPAAITEASIPSDLSLKSTRLIIFYSQSQLKRTEARTPAFRV